MSLFGRDNHTAALSSVLFMIGQPNTELGDWETLLAELQLLISWTENMEFSLYHPGKFCVITQTFKRRKEGNEILLAKCEATERSWRLKGWKDFDLSLLALKEEEGIIRQKPCS